jgi:hypothetical protein
MAATTIMTQDKPSRRRRVLRFTAPRREAFLVFLAQSGNLTAAAAAVGIDRSTAEQRRKRDAEFELGCRAALAEADLALAGAEDAFGAEGQGAFNVIKRSRRGRTQIIRAGAKRWSRAIEDRFFAALSVCGNVAAAARAVGFTEGCIWARRRNWSAFRARMEEALDEADINIEFRLASMGCDLGAAGGEAGMGTVTSDCPLPFDPDLALRYLKWRQLKRTGQSGRRGKYPAERPFEEVVESIMTKVEAIDRHENKRLLEEGWSQDEETGRMIPPGWVRRDPPSPEARAGEPGDEG